MGAVFGAIIGGVASLVAANRTAEHQRQHEEANRKARARTARKLVAREIDHNLAVLSQYLRTISIDNPARGRHLSGYEWYALHPPPAWSTSFWVAELPTLVETVADSDLIKVFDFYSSLRAYSEASSIAAAYQNAQTPGHTVPQAYGVRDKVAEKLQQFQNPLRGSDA